MQASRLRKEFKDGTLEIIRQKNTETPPAHSTLPGASPELMDTSKNLYDRG